jgi:hypothetical protein
MRELGFVYLFCNDSRACQGPAKPIVRDDQTLPIVKSLLYIREVLARTISGAELEVKSPSRPTSSCRYVNTSSTA